MCSAACYVEYKFRVYIIMVLRVYSLHRIEEKEFKSRSREVQDDGRIGGH